MEQKKLKKLLEKEAWVYEFLAEEYKEQKELACIAVNNGDVYVGINAPSDFFAYEVVDGIIAEPIVVKGYKANIALSNNGEPKKYDDIEEFNQLSTILLANEMYYSRNILSAVFGIDDDSEFENENRNKFIDAATIEKIEKAVNVAESRNEYNIRKDEQLAKQRRKNQENEKSYRNTLEF